MNERRGAGACCHTRSRLKIGGLESTTPLSPDRPSLDGSPQETAPLWTLFFSLKVLMWLNDLGLFGASAAPFWTPRFVGWALAPSYSLPSSCSWGAPVTLPDQRPPCCGLLHLPEAPTPCRKHFTRQSSNPGNQSTFYFTAHSCKFLHFQGNQITFRLALLVTKYKHPGFKNKIGWYPWTLLSL